jgi:putative CocE/NonD family hydrolase
VREAPPAPVVVELDVAVPMRDGTRLRCDVYRPASDGRFPVILGRTTYGKSTWGRWIEPERTAAAGFVVVVNDMRGHFASEGELDPFATDVADGYDSVEWCAAQPWSNGRVGMFGSSACGFSQLQAAAGRPPHLAAIAPMQTWTAFGRGCVYDPGGAFSMYTQEWALLVATSDPARVIGADRPDFALRYAELARARWEVGRWHAHLPVGELPPLPRDVAPWFYRWLEHPEHDGWWQGRDVTPALPELALPGLHLVGWYDRFCRSTVANFQSLRAHGPQKLVIGPWPHGVPVQTASGDRHFGPAAWVDARELVIRWYDRWLRDAPNGIDDEPPVRLYVLGQDAWRDAADWPVPGTRFTAFHLRSGGSANTRAGDGVLSSTPPADEPPDTYLYDPSDPTPSVPGRMARPSGSVDQGPIEDRRDVLCYTTPPLERDLDVIGPVTARIWASSSALDTDWLVKLVDVAPDGRVDRLCEGMVRARYRESHATPTLLDPGRAYAFDIDLGPVGNRFTAGHRVRVEVASASFPQFDRNMNTGGTFGTETTGIVARQRVLHDAEHASQIVLPIVPG